MEDSRTFMPMPFTLAVVAALALAAPASAFADDAAGLLRVPVETNAGVVIVMPFLPFGDGTPTNFLSGPFIGGDGETPPDRLYVFPESSETNFAAAYSNGGWIDPSTGGQSDAVAGVGDSLVLIPGGGGDGPPFDFFVFGGAPGVATRPGAPLIRGLAVDPQGAFADVGVLTGGLATDIYALDFATNYSESASWEHLGRHPGHAVPLSLRDDAPPASGGRVYLVADATRDTDGDGLPDEMECRIFGTSPYLADTDGDGLSDALELAWDGDPLVADATLTLFSESFEWPGAAIGDIHGQNGWCASATNSALVQTAVVHGGEAALEVRGGSPDGDGAAVDVAHPVAGDAGVVWVDLWQRCQFGGEEFDAKLNAVADAFAVIAFDASGHPVMSDGNSFVTNAAVAVEDEGDWFRSTSRYDFTSRKWDFYLNGVIAGEGLSMRGNPGSMHSLGVSGGHGCLDDICVGLARPEGLSSDGDALPDEWEFRLFGTLARDGSGDFDGDGLSDLQEFMTGTDPAAADTDGDGIPDFWEVALGLDPLDSSDAAGDTDGDGIASINEWGIGTDPLLRDTDGDGMPDGWEAANGTDPLANDAMDDPDGDGLANIGEMLHGTDWRLADTDGDGVSDYMEILNARSDPCVADIALGEPADLCGRAPGASFASYTGSWRAEADGSACANDRAGSLTWRLAVPDGGADALAVSIGQHGVYSRSDTFDLSLYVDGLFVARQIVFAPYGSRADAFFFLPETTPGEHDFRLVWRNWAVNTFLVVYDLRFVAFGGPDGDGDGIPDWKNHRAAEASALDELPLESLVSPLCVEGRDLWRDILEIEVATLDTNLVYSTVKTIGDGFYADIPLPTNGTSVISMRDRALAQSFQVEWAALDVFEGEFATNALTVRVGDSLKIAPPGGGAEGEVSVCMASGETWSPVTNWTASAATPFRFDAAGLYLVTVARPGPVQSAAGALVDVVRSRFPKRNPAILMDAAQTLDCPALSPRNILEHDSGLQVSAEAAGGGVSLSLLTHESRDLGLVSRLGVDGPISDAVQVTPVWADNGTFFRVIDSYGDGSQLVEVSLLLGAVPEGLSVTLSIFVSGVTFEDGTRTRTLTAGDFDENGHASVRFIRARGVRTSVCHSTTIRQDGKLLYSNR